MGMGLLIPFLIGRTVDDIREGGGDLTTLALALVAAGVLRLVFSVVRRLVAGRVSLGVEFDLRNLMYRHLQSLELAFFDSQQTGQLMSRSTVDLQAVRFFLGYGLIFMVQAALTILIAAGVMLAVNPILAAVALAPTPFVIWVAFRYGLRNRPAVAGGAAAHRRADCRGRGERLGRARGQGVRAGGAPAAAVQPRRPARVRPVDGLHAAARLLQPLHRLPAPAGPRGDPAGGRPAGDQRDDHARRVRGVLRLRADPHRADAHARRVARHGPARGGLGRASVRDPRPRAAADLPRRCPAAPGRRRPGGAAGRLVRLRGRRARAARRGPRRRGRADRRRAGRPPARARPRS